MSTPIPNCPYCKERLTAKKWSCHHCGIHLEGNIKYDEFPRWSSEEWEFVKTFLLCEGNIQLTGKEIGISYPTVKQKIAQVVKALKGQRGKAKKESESEDPIEKVLQLLARGKIDQHSAELIISSLN